MKNPYLPMPVRLKTVRLENETGDLKTFDLVFVNPDAAENFKFVCGQFAMLSINGVGEALRNRVIAVDKGSGSIYR